MFKNLLDNFDGKCTTGVREGGVAENASYYILTQAADGAFEAFPVQEWYDKLPYSSILQIHLKFTLGTISKLSKLIKLSVTKKLRKSSPAEIGPSTCLTSWFENE